MKNTILLLAFVLPSVFGFAQENTLETLGHDFTSFYYYFSFPHLMRPLKTLSMVEDSDGNIVADMVYRIKDPKTDLWVDVSNGFYTISRQDFAVIDSSFLEAEPTIKEDNTNSMPLLINDPDGDGFLYAKFVTELNRNNERSVCTCLEIMHCDEDFNFDETTYVSLEENIEGGKRSMLLEKDEHIVARYVVDDALVLARVGLNGTLLDKKPMPGLFEGDSWNINGMVTFNDAPLEYAIFGWETTTDGDTTFLFHVVDSLFELQETVVMENESGHFHYFNNLISMLPYDEESYFVVSQYYKDNQPRNGLRITKYDKTSHEQLRDTLISSQPIYTNLSLCAFPIGFQKSSDGNLYLAYRTCNEDERGGINVLKLDTNLDALWLRQCHVMERYETFQFYRMKVLEHGVFLTSQHSWGALYSGDRHHTIMFLVNDNGTVSTSETEGLIRPYAFYPNPAQSQLHLEYSPDITPAKVELYDLQGRLVHVQNKGLENVNLQGLPAGQYLLKVTLTDGNNYTDKVVKE